MTQDPSFQINAVQTVFSVFYAIFWGGIFNVQARWKAFHWPLIFRIRQARCRTLLSFLLFNVVPVAFFALAMWALGDPIRKHAPLYVQPLGYACAVVAAFFIFGVYRIWLGVIESFPKRFYAATRNDICKKYWHVEPTFDTQPASSETPVVYLGKDTGCANLLTGVIYAFVATAALAIAAFVLKA